MNTVELIRKKRFGGELTEQEIRDFIKGVTTGEIADYQISAMLMAICMAGMSDRETLALTLAMEKSGTDPEPEGHSRGEGGQAFHRRRGGYHHADSGAAGGGLRGKDGQDVRPGAGLYRRHAG